MASAAVIIRRRALLPALLAAALTACGEGTPGVIEGRPSGPYRLILELDPADPRPGEPADLTFRLTHTASGEPVRGLQVMHQRVIHNFIVSRDFRHFAHIHHEDFQPLTKRDLAQATYHFPYTFPQAGHYRIVSEFTHRDRSWTKHFDVAIGDAGQVAPAPADPAQETTVGAYRARLLTSPDPPVAGHPAELVLHLERDGEPVTDLALHLGAEVHVAAWRIDGRHFGHMHSYTPRMAAMMQMPGAGAGPRHRAMMMRLEEERREPVYRGPRVPVRHVFAEPGIYRIFFQAAPRGRPQTFDFTLEVREYRPGVELAIESMVDAADGPAAGR